MDTPQTEDQTKEKIKTEFVKVAYKTGYIKKLALIVDRAPQTIRKTWFSESGFWSIPTEYYQTILDTLEQEPKK